MKSVKSLSELRRLANIDERYAALASIASQNLGGSCQDSLDRCLQNLENNALETSEEGVVDEINFCIDMM